MKTNFLLVLLLAHFISLAQVGIGTVTPNNSSALDITSTNSGLLIPRVGLTNVLAQTPITNTPATSLLVWNTNATTVGGEGIGYYYWDGVKWVYLINTNTISTYITPHNTLDMAYDQGGAGSGRTITADNGIVLINGTDGIRTSGVLNSGSFLGSTSGIQMFFYPRIGAFRAGTGSWNHTFPGTGNVGDFSVAMGSGNTASGQFSLALVNGSSAEAESAVAIGNGARAVQQDDMALGQGALANGSSATAIGESTEATGRSSIAIGSSAHSIGDNSTALGDGCQAEAINSTAIGFASQALGNESLAIGSGIRTDSFREFSLGSNNTNGGGNQTTWVATDRLLSIGNGTTAASPSNALTILKNGNTGIGINNPLEKFEVNGNAKADTFISQTTTYPDYVFENHFNGASTIKLDYKMLTLDEAEIFVQKNGHMYGVKSYSEIKAQSMNINLAETSITNLEKIEELFIYIIELNTKITNLKKENIAFRRVLDQMNDE